MGRAAAELLFNMIDENRNREEGSDVVLYPLLVVRQSTAPHRADDRKGGRRRAWNRALEPGNR
jgi:hypothetical protein